MKHYLPHTPKPRKPLRQIPPFYAVPVRHRDDGWTPVRQAEFIGILAETRSVSKAVRELLMGRESVYRLRQRAGADSFNAAWDVAMANPGTPQGEQRLLAAQIAARHAVKSHAKVTIPELRWRIDTGIWHVILRGGIYQGVRRKPDKSALLTLLSRVPEHAREGLSELYC